MMIKKEVIIIGGGAAGLAAATACRRLGIEDILIIERETALGGILKQCIHDGFGLIKFKQSYTGPEYAQKYIDQVEQLKIPYLLDSMVIDLSNHKVLTVANKEGLHKYQAQAVILAMGCRERTRGALSIPGSRPAGIYTAGVAQNLINIHNYMIGKEIVILGSGDIGLIMARRLTLEGARVKMVLEILPYGSGLPRNFNQCLFDYDIPLYLRHTVINIKGDKRLQSVTVAEVDEQGRVFPQTQKEIPCDTLLLSVGLIPENELSQLAGITLDPVTGGAKVDEVGQTNIPGIFACGNVLQVHDIVDNVSLEGEQVASGVAKYLSTGLSKKIDLSVQVGEGIRYVLPQRLHYLEDTIFSFRVQRPGHHQTLVFKTDQHIIKKKTFLQVNPAEMIRIKLSAQELTQLSNLKVELES
ncbi:MAG: FAD-dependent oxidoreductase [Candidatus Caldatribacteriota bacterium]